jgi:hypothetical protein
MHETNERCSGCESVFKVDLYPKAERLEKTVRLATGVVLLCCVFVHIKFVTWSFFWRIAFGAFYFFSLSFVVWLFEAPAVRKRFLREQKTEKVDAE